MIDEVGTRDPFADFLRALQGHDTVTLSLEGIGETKYSAKEIYEMIDFKIKNLQVQLTESKAETIRARELLHIRLDSSKIDNRRLKSKNRRLKKELTQSQAREKAAVAEVCKVCECLTYATGNGWKNSCDECEWCDPEAGEEGEGNDCPIKGIGG